MRKLALAAAAVLVLAVAVLAKTGARTQDCPDLSSCIIYPAFSVVANDSYVKGHFLVGPNSEASMDAFSLHIQNGYFFHVEAMQKFFKIDHPGDPANKYLIHSSVESPDMKNIYDGLTTLNDEGVAWVQLPSWFSALNGDFRYQLTAIGRPGANLYVAEEISNNRFKIAGGSPRLKVSWQVTGIRHDRSALARPYATEEEKSAADKGKYLDPVAFGQPERNGILAAKRTEIQVPAAPHAQ